MTYELRDYVEVADRIAAWYEEHPDGRIETSILTFTDERVTVAASVYRDSGSVNPAGTGHSFMAIPGTTPYTRGSELENAETSAVGRALVMAGIPAKNVASANEVRGKQEDVRSPVPVSAQGVAPGSDMGEGTAPGCLHTATTTERFGSKAQLPQGRHRCLDCGAVSEPGGIFKGAP